MADPKLKDLEEQLKRIGANFQFWGRSELRELANVLLPGEIVEHCVNGTYDGGFALLAATDQRVLLVDKKPMYLTLEDVRFDMISEIDYNHRLLNATVFICTPNKSLRFRAYNHARLRKLFHFVQTRVMEIRQHYQHQGQIWKDYADSLQAAQPAPLAIEQPAQGYSPAIALPLGPAPGDVPQISQISQVPSTIATAVPPPFPLPPMGMHTVAPIISAYTRMPLMSRQRRFLGSKAMNTPQPSIYQ